MTTALESTNNPRGSDASRRLNYVYSAWRAAGVDADLAHNACEQLLRFYRPRSRASSACI